MLLPAIQYGPWSVVKARMRRVVSQLKRGANLVEVMTRDGMLDVADTPGLIVMIRSILGPISNFHCFAPMRDAWEALSDLRTEPTVPSAAEESTFADSLRTPWGILGLLSPDNQPWLIRKSWHQAFLDAALEFWNELDSVGPRYFWVGQGERLWARPNNLHYVLANMGVPNDALRAPLPPDGPRALLRYARAQS